MLATKATCPSHELEPVPCYWCQESDAEYFISANDDLTGKAGTFTFVKCNSCQLVYQDPRVTIEGIPDFYDDEYIAHRKENNFGVLNGFYEWSMDKHDREKNKIISKYVSLDSESSVLDVGCAVGTFLQKMRKLYQCNIAGVDFKDVSYYKDFDKIEFHNGLFYEQDVGEDRFDLITMWHFLEHDYDPLQSLRHASRALSSHGRLIIEVPRLDSLSYRLFKERWPGLQAPQHTVLFDKASLHRFCKNSGLEVVDYLPYGAFPAYFYLFAGVLFKIKKGKGINLRKSILPYFLGQLMLSPLLAFEKQLNLSMQTIVCAKKAV